MVFNSYTYVFIFLPSVFFIYFILRKSRLQNVFLVAASLMFYCYNFLWYGIPLIVSSVLDFLIGRRMDREDGEAARRRLLILSVCVNLAILSFFKYAGWLSGGLAGALAVLGVSVSAISPPLPPGISFYTFQTMSYTIDIYRKEFRSTSSFINFMSFVSFFPQLVAGPIERARDLLPQLERVRPRAGYDVIGHAAYMILFGLMLKTVVADNVGKIVEYIERNLVVGTPNTEGLGLLYAYGFAFQIYGDFAAYSIIAIGSAKLFGIHLNRNFLTPYFSSSPSEFWRRWHISLSSWLRDYLYVSLGGNRFGKIITLRNLMITMVLGGLWHGAGVLFIVWGIWHGLLLVTYRLLPIDEFLQRRLGRLGKILAIFIFFHLACVGWIFFRATPDTFWLIWSSILSTPHIFVRWVTVYAPHWQQVADGQLSVASVLPGSFGGFVTQNWLLSVYGFGILLFSLPAIIADAFGYRHGCELTDLYPKMTVATKVVTILLFLYLIMFFGRRAGNEFIYFQF